jgi:hypothetical protein
MHSYLHKKNYPCKKWVLHDIIQIFVEFKNFCRIHFNLENYETNFI